MLEKKFGLLAMATTKMQNTAEIISTPQKINQHMVFTSYSGAVSLLVTQYASFLSTQAISAHKKVQEQLTLWLLLKI